MLMHQRQSFASRRSGIDTHSAPFQNTAQSKDVSGIIVDEQYGSTFEVFVRAMQALQHPLLIDGQIADDAMQKERRLIEQALRRF